VVLVIFPCMPSAGILSYRLSLAGDSVYSSGHASRY
jgi:hypothetical protein